MKAILMVSENEHGVQGTLEKSCGCDWCWRGTERQFAADLGTAGANVVLADILDSINDLRVMSPMCFHG